MVSLKHASAIFIFAVCGSATTLLTSPGINLDGHQLLQDPDRREEHWNIIMPFIEEMYPGIVCSIHADNSSTRNTRNIITSSIESSLMDIHPSISCVGELDESRFLPIIDQPIQTLEKRRDCPNSDFPPAPALAPHPEVKTNNDVQTEVKAQNSNVNAQAQQGFTNCERATRPANCRACWSGAAASAASEFGVCATAAYAANRATPRGQYDAQVWFAMICCTGAVIGNFVVATSGCIGR